MNKLFYTLIGVLLSFGAVASVGDSTIVRVFDKFHMNRYGNFDQKVKLPSSQQKNQRIWLKYTLGCLSNGQCEWDYTLKLFVREHTGVNDSTLKQAPYLKVNGTAKDSASYSVNPTWVNVFNTTTKTTDSVLTSTQLLSFYADTLQPLVLTDTLRVYAANYYRYSFDTIGAKVDSVWVPATNVVYQKYTAYYSVFEVINNVELGRFISPYAKTFPKSFQYDYIYDVTDYAGLLHDSTEFRIEYQGYSYGFTATWDMIMVEGNPAREVIKVENIYNGGYNYGQATSIETALSAKTFTVPADAKAVKARIIITGHGGENNENCAEFCPKYMYLKLNSTQIAQQLVWKEDCGENAIAAQPGTWIYNRANWCPGERIRNYDYNLNVAAGSTNTIDLDMESFVANGGASYNISLQLIYYKDFAYQTDAAIEEILAPTRAFWHNRSNPICDNAKFIFKNWGANTLTSAEFAYQIGNAPEQKIGWNGNLAFEQEETVTIPYMNWPNAITDSTFKIWITKVNGVATDDNALNNRKQEGFSLPYTLPNAFIIETRTNNQPAQNSYTLTDAQGNVLLYKTFSTANTLYRDTFNLQWGCYSLNFVDSAGNGLGWWAASSEGTGMLRIRTATSPIRIFTSFNTDFGSSVKLNFRVQFPLATTEQLIDATQVNVFPNPAQTEIVIDGFDADNAVITDITGRVIQTSKLTSASISVSEIPVGVYMLQLTNNKGQQVIKKITIVR